jgi:two-component system sensor histidine kinase AgrC
MKIYNTELPSSLENASFSLARHLMKTIALNAIAYGLLVACCMFMLEGRRVPLTPNQSVLFALFIIILVLWMMLYVSINMIRNRNRKDQSREEYYASLKIANEEFRGVKHDFYNMLQVYDGYLQMQNYDGLQRFHRSLFQATRQAGDSLSVLESFKSRMAVYGLLQAKLQKARNAGVTLYIDLVCDLSGVVLEDLDLCRVLSVALDNAIEAAEQSSKKLVNLSFQRKEEDTIMMVLSNTTREDVDTRLIFQPGFTTKSNHAGHGLKQVRRILSQYDFCSFHVTYSQNLFTLFLLLHVKA